MRCRHGKARPIHPNTDFSWPSKRSEQINLHGKFQLLQTTTRGFLKAQARKISSSVLQIHQITPTLQDGCCATSWCCYNRNGGFAKPKFYATEMSHPSLIQVVAWWLLCNWTSPLMRSLLKALCLLSTCQRSLAGSGIVLENFLDAWLI